jgi:hypothetical protein
MSEAKGNDAQFNYLISIFGVIAGCAILYSIYHKMLILESIYHTQVKIAWITALSLSVTFGLLWLWNKIVEFTDEKNEPPAPNQILVGMIEKTNEPLYIDEETRTYHTEVVASTGGGKTEGFTLPWCFNDIKNGRGLLIIDGKPEEHFLKRIYGM